MKSKTITYDRERQLIAYVYTSPYDHAEYTEKITPRDLIARIMTHIPDPWEQRTRYFAFYSNRMRGKRKSAPGNRKSGGEERETSAPLHWRRKWAELLQLVFEVSLECPRCGTEMKIVSVLTETEPVNKILAHLRERGIDARAGPFADSAT